MSEEFVTSEIEKDDVEVELTSFKEYFDDLQLLLASIETDAIKSDGGNKSAQVRVRKGLRLLKTKATTFIKFSQGKLG